MSDDIREKIGELRAKTQAAHKRIDSLETDIRNDLNSLTAELKILNEYMNQSKGKAAALVFLTTLLGGVVGGAISLLTK